MPSLSKSDKERIATIANRFREQLLHSSSVKAIDADRAAGLLRARMEENIVREKEIEAEAMTVLRKHGQAIYQEGADFQKLLSEGKKVIAKKKGFTL